MKNRWTLAAAATALVMSQAGCHSSQTVDHDLKPKGPVSEAQRSANKAMVEIYEDEQATLAVIREHTLYPYHFINDGSRFTELGWHDVHVLASHYLNNPGPLNVRKGDTPELLYKARIKAVVDAMTEAGVKMDRIKIADGLPGGDGISSDQVVFIMEKIKSAEGVAPDKDASKSGSSSDSKKGSTSSSSNTQSTGMGSASGTGGSYK